MKNDRQTKNKRNNPLLNDSVSPISDVRAATPPPPQRRYRSSSQSPRSLSQSRFCTTRDNHYGTRSPQNIPQHKRTLCDQISILRKKRELIQYSLKIYEQIFETNLPQKCLQHNNSISLYCYKDRRLLCVNCMYVSTHHRNHRVLPLKEAIFDIQNDNINNFGEVSTNLSWLEANQRTARLNHELLKISMSKLELRLQKEFDDVMRAMSNKYLQLKQRVLDKYKRLSQENQSVYNEIATIRSLVSAGLSKLDQRKSSEDIDVLRHLMMHNVISKLDNSFNTPIQRVDTDAFEKAILWQVDKLKLHLQKHSWTKMH